MQTDRIGHSPSICASVGSALLPQAITCRNLQFSWTVPAGVTNPGNVAKFQRLCCRKLLVCCYRCQYMYRQCSGTMTINANPFSYRKFTNCLRQYATSNHHSHAVTRGDIQLCLDSPDRCNQSRQCGQFQRFCSRNLFWLSLLMPNTCTGSGSGTLTINANPTVSVNSPVICASVGSATITATALPAGTYSYAWIVPIGATNPAMWPVSAPLLQEPTRLLLQMPIHVRAVVQEH